MESARCKAFVTAAETGSFSKAGEVLGYTPSGVSQLVTSLERELGLPLLGRNRKGVTLTENGRRLLPAVREFLQQENRIYQLAGEMSGLLVGSVTIATYSSVATHWLPAMMMRFQQEHPQVEFELFNGDYHDVDRWLADGSVDLAFVALPAEADSRCVPLYRDELVAVLPKGHRLCSLPVCPAAEIAKEPIISLLETSNHDVRRALDAVGAKPDIRFRTKDDYAVIAMVRQGLGVSIMPSLLLRGNNEGVELRPLDPPAYRTIALTMGSVETGPAARQFAEFARAWVKENA